jgi:hypothetical protein
MYTPTPPFSAILLKALLIAMGRGLGWDFALNLFRLAVGGNN